MTETATAPSEKPPGRRPARQPKPAPATGRPALPSLPAVEATSTILRGVVINITFLIAFVLIVPALLTQLWKDQVVIAPIAVPQAMADRGLTSDVMANRIWDALQSFVAEAQIAKSTIVAVPQGQNFDFSLTQAGISINGVLSQIRAFFNLYETRITGEVTCATGDCARDGIQLRLRIVRNGATVIDLPPMAALTDLQYMRLAAEGVFNELDPFVSIAALAKSQPDRAIVLARRLVREQSPSAKWAQNLVGEILLNEGSFDDALAAFDAALKMDAAFAAPLVNRALALAHLGQFDAAAKGLDDAAAKGVTGLALVKARASVAFMRGDKPAAVGYFLEAATLEPREPRHLVLAGTAELDLHRTADGEAHLLEALALDPGNPDALSALGNLYYGKFGDPARIDEAVKMYRNWANYDSGNSRAWFSLGNGLLAKQDYDGALAAYDKAIALGDTAKEIRIVRAGALMGLALGGARPLSDAIAAFEGVANLSPPEPTVFLSLGKLYAKSGDTAKAISAYRRYLEVAPADAASRSFAADELRRLGG